MSFHDWEPISFVCAHKPNANYCPKGKIPTICFYLELIICKGSGEDDALTSRWGCKLHFPTIMSLVSLHCFSMKRRVSLAVLQYVTILSRRDVSNNTAAGWFGVQHLQSFRSDCVCAHLCLVYSISAYLTLIQLSAEPDRWREVKKSQE